MTSEKMNKFILDATCGCRTIWFQKKQQNTLYIDQRKEERGFIKDRPNFSVQPDIVMDFRNMSFEDKKFKLVVWDPPHLVNIGKTAQMRLRYGGLDRVTWKEDLSKGFKECWRVLEDYGILIFKWNERDIPLKEILSCFNQTPLFGHPSGSNSKTYWCCFMKIPKGDN